MEKLEFIINQLDSYSDLEGYKVKEVIEDKKSRYTEEQWRLKRISMDDIKAHDFKLEVLKACSYREKIDLIPELKKLVHSLERHAYGPELNKLHLLSGETISTPNKTTIDNAVRYWVQTSELENLKNKLQ